MTKAITFTETNFNVEVLESNELVVVDFWAGWCGPCRILGPTMEKLAEQYAGTNIKVGKLNVDENPLVAQGFSISSIPAVLVFKNGEVVERLVGALPKEKYEEVLAKLQTAAV
jgi:thioredoxin 1